jgi:DNA topoisomerase IB
METRRNKMNRLKMVTVTLMAPDATIKIFVVGEPAIIKHGNRKYVRDDIAFPKTGGFGRKVYTLETE